MTAPISPLDALLGAADRALRTMTAPAHATRLTPGDASTAALPHDDAARREAAALMRVNHAGEIAAQALYHGQALTAATPALRDHMLEAAREENDHLAWCATRLDELHDRPSYLAPLWYAGSFAIGVAAGAFGERNSLGFVAETERQVEGHLHEHLQRLPVDDLRSRAIVQAMQRDEIDHGRRALAAGGNRLPLPVRALMRAASRVMTRTAHWF